VSLAPIWLSVALGWVAIVVLVALRLRYPYRTIWTDHFVVQVPRPWLQRSVYVIALLELCRRTAQTSFALSRNARAEVEIRPSWRPAFWFQPESQRIVLCFLFGPAIDRWLFLFYFAIAHEYGHFISLAQTEVEGEVWANLFCLYTLHVVVFSYKWPHWWERWLVRRDAFCGLASMRVWRFLPGPRRKIAAGFWELWQIARRDSKAAASAIRRDA
jgi:hypothetical protein